MNENLKYGLFFLGGAALGAIGAVAVSRGKLDLKPFAAELVTRTLFCGPGSFLTGGMGLAGVFGRCHEFCAGPSHSGEGASSQRRAFRHAHGRDAGRQAGRS